MNHFRSQSQSLWLKMALESPLSQCSVELAQSGECRRGRERFTTEQEKQRQLRRGEENPLWGFPLPENLPFPERILQKSTKGNPKTNLHSLFLPKRFSYRLRFCRVLNLYFYYFKCKNFFFRMSKKRAFYVSFSLSFGRP